MQACAPGKLIISGEHAVVYGAQALAVALARYTRVSFKPLSQSRTINTLFAGISSGVQYPLTTLTGLKQKLDQRFEAFLQGQLPVQRILNQPDDLLMYTLSALIQHLPLPGRAQAHSYLPMPGRLTSESDLPPGAGMGSSAAAIAATLVLFEQVLEKPLTVQQRFELVRFCERLQHGRGSAIDAATVTYGGINHLHNQQIHSLDISLDPHWYWVFTGRPTVSTGECVQQVRRYHQQDSQLWQQFDQVCAELITAIGRGRGMVELLRENHRLLCHIGVVPEPVQQFIARIEAAGGAAKISGAGAHQGATGGLVLVYLPNTPLAPLLSGYPAYQWDQIKEDTQGARYLSD